MSGCGRRYNWFLGCKFEPRYDVSAVTAKPEITGRLSADGVARILERYQNKTYVADVCVRCGKTVKRESGE